MTSCFTSKPSSATSLAGSGSVKRSAHSTPSVVKNFTILSVSPFAAGAGGNTIPFTSRRFGFCLET